MPYSVMRCRIEMELEYLVYLPPEYDNLSNKKWPLIIFLHGAGERGSNIEDVKKYGIHKVINEKDIPFIVISPQCPKNTVWEMYFTSIDKLIREVPQLYRADENNIFLTGISMGGYGVWNYAMLNPDKFAAIVPVCGGAQYYWRAGSLKNTPVWAFHGQKDKAVPFEESKRVVDELEKCGGKVRFSVFPDAGHEVCTLAYENDELFNWLLDCCTPPIGGSLPSPDLVK